MTFAIKPATDARFDDLSTILAPKSATAQGCWCLSWRLAPAENEALRAPHRAEMMRDLCRHRPAPGLLAHDGDEVVGWAAIAPREQYTAPNPDRFPAPEGAWALTCFRVRTGHGRKGVARALLDGAVAHAERHHALSVVAYPVDAGEQKIDRTQASVGLLSWFTDAGFTVDGDTGYRVNGCPRVVAVRTL